MLFMNPPVAVIDGVTFYPDHQNDAAGEPVQWYYQPLSPRVTTVQGAPQLALRKFVSETDAFALLDVDVNLGIDPGSLESLRQKLKERLGLKGDPRVAPMQPSEGTVKLMLLGRASDSAGDAQLVKGITFPAAPSLYNDNRAIFSALLTPSGAALVEASLKGTAGEMTTVGVVYALTFDALRPAYAISAQAHWSQIHKYLSERFSGDSVFFGADISKAVDDMKDSRVITLSVDNMLGDAEQSSAVQAMLGQVRAMIFDSFFTPAVPPKQEKTPSFLDQLNGLVATGTKNASVLGMLGHFSWSKTDLTELLQKDLQIDLRERTVVKMKLNPQGYLADVARGLDPTRLVQEINATSGSDFFKYRNLQVDTNLPFEVDNISSVSVDLSYEGEQKSQLFKPAAQNPPATPRLTWTSRLDANKKMVRPIQGSFTVNFAPRADGTWPTTLTSEKRPITGDFWTVNPRELYSFSTINFLLPPEFPWDRYPVVTLSTRYNDPANKVALSQIFSITKGTLLDNGATGVQWKIFQRNPSLRQYQYKLSYQMKSGGRVDAGDWVTTELPLVIIDPPGRDLWLMPPAADSWPADLQLITVQLTYDDPKNNLHLRPELIQIFRNSAAPQKLRLLVVDPSQVTVGYQATFYKASGTDTVPLSRTNDTILRLLPGMKGRNIATVRPDPQLFATGNVTRVVVRASHVERGLQDQTAQFTFKSATDSGTFAYDFLQNPGYSLRAIYSFTNDDPFTKRIEVSDPDSFLVPVPSPDGGD